MVKYIHCEKCKKVIDTIPWIGVVHTYNGICLSCMEEEQQENQLQQENAEEYVVKSEDMEQTEKKEDIQEPTPPLPLQIEKSLLSGLEERVNDVLSGEGSIDVLIKEIKVGLVDKAKERIEETFQSFDVNKIEAQKLVDYVEKKCDYLSEYKEYMDNIVIKLQTNPKMKVKTAIEKVYKETVGNLPKTVTKDVLLNKKETLKTVFGKSIKWYNIYSDTEDVFELTKKMILHPFCEIQKKLSTLPFYNLS